MKQLIEKILNTHGVRRSAGGFSTADLPVSLPVKSGRYLVQVGEGLSEVILFISHNRDDNGDWIQIQKTDTCIITNELATCRYIEIRIGSLYSSACQIEYPDRQGRVTVFGHGGKILSRIGNQLDKSLWMFRVRFDSGQIGIVYNWQIDEIDEEKL